MDNRSKIIGIPAVFFTAFLAAGCGESWEERCQKGCENFIFCLGVTEGVDECTRLCLDTLEPCFHLDTAIGCCTDEKWCESADDCRTDINNFCEIQQFLVSCNSIEETDCGRPKKCFDQAVDQFRDLPDPGAPCRGYLPDMYKGCGG